MRIPILALALLLGGMATAAAAAESCVEAVDRFAADNHLSATPPQTGPEAGATGTPERPATLESRGMTGALAESGGVIRPPDTGSGIVVAPPETGSRMPTAPEPRPGGPAAEDGSSGRAAQSERVAALLTAARAAAERGDDAQCFERLGEAKAAVRADRGQPG